MTPLTIDYSMFVPISRLPHRIRNLLTQSRGTDRPIIVTQRGYPTAVVLTIEQYTALQETQKPT